MSLQKKYEAVIVSNEAIVKQLEQMVMMVSNMVPVRTR
jgi:hypothetical protein